MSFKPDCDCWVALADNGSFQMRKAKNDEKIVAYITKPSLNKKRKEFWQSWWAFCPCEGCGKPAKEVDGER